jgi:hypothetical protein
MSESFVVFGILLFVLAVLPVLLIRNYRQKRKVRQIIESHRIRNEQRSQHNTEGIPGAHSEPEDQTVPEGWGMNNSPFRERKSGLTWGGGNIKASEAKRGTKRKFMGK